jgi:hypothetical protein
LDYFQAMGDDGNNEKTLGRCQTTLGKQQGTLHIIQIKKKAKSR